MQYNGNHKADKYFYLHDRLGSVRQIVDKDGLVVKYYTFGPFGDTRESGGSLDDPFMFTGQWFDSEIGQYYLRARQYDPELMRFSSRDPVFGQFEEPMTLHKYLYCLNNPINRIDPFGLDAYLIFDPHGGPDFWDESEDLGHVSVGVDAVGGKILVGSASYFHVDKPSLFNNLDEASAHGNQLVIHFKTKEISKGVTSDMLIYQYIRYQLAKGTYAESWCSIFAQQTLAYGEYQLGIVNGWFPTWLYESALWSAKYDNNISIEGFGE